MKNTQEFDMTKLKGFNVNILNGSKVQFKPNDETPIAKGGMSLSDAIQLMGTSIDIEDWNANRQTVKESVGISAFLDRGYCQAIDCQGLVSKVLPKGPAKVYKPFIQRNNG